MSTPSRIVLELDSGAVPIAGRLLLDGREPRPFMGWTALFGLLREMTPASAIDVPEPPRRSLLP